ncbi:MAG: extracellular solute-binding protein, partial [bacterium]
SEDFIGPILRGEVSAQQAWSGPAAKAVRESDGELSYVVPGEGSALWVTCAAIPAEAPDPDASLACLAALMDPELTSLATSNGGYATPNDAARSCLPLEIREDPTLFPDDLVMARCSILRDLDEGEAQMQSLFSHILDLDAT